jgi:hypothetical protein
MIHTFSSLHGTMTVQVGPEAAWNPALLQVSMTSVVRLRLHYISKSEFRQGILTLSAQVIMTGMILLERKGFQRTF